MLRVVAHQEDSFSEEAKLTLGLLGVLIETQPDVVTAILQDNNIVVSKQAGAKELTRKLLYLIENSNSAVRLQIARGTASILPKQQEYQNFNQPSQGGPDVTVGADPVSHHVRSKVPPNYEPKCTTTASHRWLP